MTNTTNQPSILIIGATGGTGLQCLRHLAQHPSKPSVHVFCRDPAKLSAQDKALCTSVSVGDARKTRDVQKALVESAADYCILVTGAGSNTGKTDIRQATGEALAAAMKNPQLEHVKTVVVSSNGAGESKIIVGAGMGMIISHMLRHVLNDHTKQEAAFFSSGKDIDGIAKRTIIVRPTSLTDGKDGKILVEFGDKVKGPSIHADRSDVAAWITREICDTTDFRGGQKFNITSTKQ